LKELVNFLEISPLTPLYAIGDGAKWVKDVLESLHPNVKFLLDYYHAASYVDKVSLLKLFTKKKQGRKQGRKYRKKLKSKGGRSVIRDLKALKEEVDNSSLSEKDKKSDLLQIESALRYLEEREDQMFYTQARREGRPIGSGFIESACKLIVKQRLGLSGGRFYMEAAERIMQLRCIILMNAWELLTDLMYKKNFSVKDCQSSSSYEPVIMKAA
jgi:hypothetical protein